MTYGSPAFIQAGALAAFTAELPEVEMLRADYRTRAELVCRILADAPHCRVIPPEGGMFVLLDVRGTGLGAEAFARALLDEEAVAVLPCDGFGPSAVGQLRLSLTAADARLEEAGRRIVRLARRLAPGGAA
jgi:arginine:pyruvate transaminase